jgi:hypothetical protein
LNIFSEELETRIKPNTTSHHELNLTDPDGYKAEESILPWSSAGNDERTIRKVLGSIHHERHIEAAHNIGQVIMDKPHDPTNILWS